MKFYFNMNHLVRVARLLNDFVVDVADDFVVDVVDVDVFAAACSCVEAADALALL